MHIHKTREGKMIPLDKMESNHLIATIRLHIKLSKKGITLRYGGGHDPDTYWYDEEFIKGDEVLNYFNHNEYIREAKKRDLLHLLK